MPEIPAATHVLDAMLHWSPHGCGAANRIADCKREHLAGAGWRHTLLAPGAEEHGSIDCGGVHVGSRHALASHRVARLIADARPDIVDTDDAHRLGPAVLAATAELGVPAVASCHGRDAALLARLTGAAAASPWARWALRRAVRRIARRLAPFDLVLAPSRAVLRVLHEHGVRQAQHQPLGVDTAVFSPAANDERWRERLAQQLDVAPDTRLVIYAGSFTPARNLDVLAQAVGALGPSHCFVAVGAGPCPPLGPQVRVLPPLREPRALARLLASSDVFVHAGEYEAFGLAALEAMACGTPVVASASGGLGELVEGAGIVVPGLRVARWTEAISAALADPQSALGWAALARARALDWRLVVAHLAARYRRALRAARFAQGSVPSPSAAYSFNRL